MILEINYGPFAPLFGYVGSIVATVYGIWTLIWKKKVWKTPQEILPSTIRGLLAVILGIGMVYIWLNAKPQNIDSIINIAIIFAFIAIISFILYFALLRILTYEKIEALNSTQTKSTEVIGGLWLRKSAKIAMTNYGVRTIQELFKGSSYNLDELWSRFSQELSKSIIVILYLAIVTSGILGITASGFIVQVKLTDKNASKVIQKSDSPGLNENK